MWWLDGEKYNGRRFDASPKFDVVDDERCVCWDCCKPFFVNELISAFSCNPFFTKVLISGPSIICAG